jgi:hypothetical protein
MPGGGGVGGNGEEAGEEDFFSNFNEPMKEKETVLLFCQ